MPAARTVPRSSWNELLGVSCNRLLGSMRAGSRDLFEGTELAWQRKAGRRGRAVDGPEIETSEYAAAGPNEDAVKMAGGVTPLILGENVACRPKRLREVDAGAATLAAGLDPEIWDF
jgi:hypothetical protein